MHAPVTQRPTHTEGCNPRHMGPAFYWEVLGCSVRLGCGRLTLTHLVHLAQLLLQVLLGHASQARVDHLNNLPESSHREKLRCGGERRAKERPKGACCARGARRTNCLRCSSRFVMNFFVRIVTAPSDMVAPKDLQPKGKSCESSAKKYALWPSMGFAGVMWCEVRRPVSAARGCTAICCSRARGGRGNATEGSSGRRPPGCVLEDRQP